jgi:hypothetical protein
MSSVPPLHCHAAIIFSFINKTTRSIVAQYPSIFLPFVDNFFCFSGFGMIESMLEPHLIGNAGRQFF